jgi:hypothetical protein
MDGLTLDRVYRRGDEGGQVKLIQEWLTLHGVSVAIDGAFGPATEAAVREFQRARQLAVDGEVGERTFAALVAPMVAALRPIAKLPKRLGALVVAYAEQHLAQAPREVGGENRGPWVRLYMDGREGAAWRWCAGFVSFVLKQASDTSGAPMPVPASCSCDLLAASAKQNGSFLAGTSPQVPSWVTPGSLFLLEGTAVDWVHVGIVVKAGKEYMTTIEGNTNDSGSPEGYEVCRRLRGYDKKDFILVPAGAARKASQRK